MTTKYINDDIECGIDYDYKKVKKLFKKLGCPEDLFDPFPALMSGCRWILDLSERSVGKTTQWLLVGMCMFRLYGTIIQYVRQFEDMIMPKASSDLFATILKYDYVTKLTDGEYNTIVYKSRRWYFAYMDTETMEITRTCPDHFMFSCSVDKQQQLKSSYNCPTGDLIIFDEFVGKYTPVNEFVEFCDLTKTICRDRQSPRFVLLANITSTLMSSVSMMLYRCCMWAITLISSHTLVLGSMWSFWGSQVSAGKRDRSSIPCTMASKIHALHRSPVLMSGQWDVISISQRELRMSPIRSVSAGSYTCYTTVGM